ncbi:Dolichyl-phosphate-mannose-protein mannosyltransferase [Clostridium acidisoli DSM 12555]|uniref:Dolichyl-phosphate-mannose-protein mannosyltransferase n=1 Tax=Clostridium acidisoli DSM 12555 TaxID=1121291 RepID=A0A1W1XNG7_9CLOT|nr:glycosyltransferase family 39 protein [Clostridium acidisoli]SMC25424.1 Dolichyl-phosphate-mannose-protein mannosyltransferase [Clostridium acidisoli DSM 12555]
MRKFKLTKENIALLIIVILSAILNFVNLSIEGYGNSYYASAVKSMTMSFKNFFFVSFDPSSFVTIDKPPLGFWLQAISAKIFGFSGVSIILPSALSGIISVILLYKIVKRAFGSLAGLLSAFFLAITPVFVAVSRNNTIDNILIMFLLFALWALTIAAEKGKFKYIILTLALVGVGFNVKMLQAYLVVPAIYLTYLLSTATAFKKRIVHLIAGTLVLIVVSLSWAVVVDLVPASSRPYIDSSTNNTVTELILGHNGTERLSFGSSQKGQGGAPKDGNGEVPSGKMKGNPPSDTRLSGMPSGNMPSGGGKMNGGGGNSSGLQGSFGGQVTASFARLFSKNILSDQIVWFIPLAILGFIAAALKEKLRFKLDNTRKQSLVMWFFWFLPEFIYFSFNTGTFHSYYLTMLAPPTAALAGIGLTAMWALYKEGGLKAWLLPAALILNGAVDLLMLYYFISYSSVVKVLIVLVALFSILSSLILALLNVSGSSLDNLNLKKKLISLAVVGIILTPFVGSSTVLFTSVGNSFPAAGLELLSSSGSSEGGPKMSSSSASNSGVASKNSSNKTSMGMPNGGGNSNTKLISFLEENKTSKQKYLLVVSNSNSAADIIVSTGESVMSLGGFLGSDKILTLSQFKDLVKNGEIRYVMSGGIGGGGNSDSDIMTWVKKTGKLVSASKYSDINTDKSSSNKGLGNKIFNGNPGAQSQQLYDLKAYTDSFNK